MRANIQFAPLTPNGHSSSVTDLFASFHSAMSFLLDLEWDDPEQMAAFATRLSKVCVPVALPNVRSSASLSTTTAPSLKDCSARK